MIDLLFIQYDPRTRSNKWRVGGKAGETCTFPKKKRVKELGREILKDYF
jgi:hypothetical protein